MYYYFICSILTIFLLSSIACQPNPTQKESTTAKKAETSTPQKAKVLLSNQDFTVEPGKVVAKKNMPYMDIILSCNKLNQTAVLTNDHNFFAMTEEKARTQFNMPSDVAFAFNTWYAGGGNYYYGIVDQNKLNVYTTFIDEGHPDQEEEVTEISYQLFKTFVFSEHNMEVIVAK